MCFGFYYQNLLSNVITSPLFKQLPIYCLNHLLVLLIIYLKADMTEKQETNMLKNQSNIQFLNKDNSTSYHT